MLNTTNHHRPPFYILLLLILAGEGVFLLPFVLARIFRPTFLEVFELNNFQLGTCFSIYGIVALLSYAWGGILADRVQPKVLLAVALFLTAFGGLYMASYPSYPMMKVLYGYWGFTTIFLFWSAMIKATRQWGGNHMQGRAFGFLDGGRGLVGAAMGSLGVMIFAYFITGDADSVEAVNRRLAFKSVIHTVSILILLIGLLILLFFKTNPDKETQRSKTNTRDTLANVRKLLRLPTLWWLMLIILCAYVGYKITDDFSLYAHDVMQYDEVEAAQVGTLLLYIRPVVGIAIGILADRSKPSLLIILGFFAMLLGALIFGSGIINASMHYFFILSLIATALGIYAIRALYFAVLQEGHIPLALTGTAVGLVSFVGYTPDIFVGPLMGYLLDNNPGELGHQHVFGMLGIFALVGLGAAIAFYKSTIRMKENAK